MSDKVLTRLIENLERKESELGLRKLRVLDFDDTLVKTDSKVRVTHADGTKSVMTPGEYAKYTKQPGDEFDYSDFQGLPSPMEIKWMTSILRRVVKKHGIDGAVVLTARGVSKPVKKFLSLFGLPDIQVVALNDSDPQAKAQWILYVAKKFNYDVIEFFDDSNKNIVAVKEIAPKAAPTKIITHLVQHRHYHR